MFHEKCSICKMKKLIMQMFDVQIMQREMWHCSSGPLSIQLSSLEMATISLNRAATYWAVLSEHRAEWQSVLSVPSVVHLHKTHRSSLQIPTISLNRAAAHWAERLYAVHLLEHTQWRKAGQAFKCQQYCSIVLGRAIEHSPTISCDQFTDCIWGSPSERVNAKSLCFRVLSRFFFSLKLQNWMLSLCSLLSLVSDHHPPKREIEGLPIGTSWWWNVKNAEYLILTFVICPKPDISMSTKTLSWYRPSGVSGPFERRGVSEQTGR